MRLSNERRITELKLMQQSLIETDIEEVTRDIRVAVLQEQIDLLLEIDKHPISINRLMDNLRHSRAGSAGVQTTLL